MPTCTELRAVIGEPDDTFCTSCGAKHCRPRRDRQLGWPTRCSGRSRATPLTAPPPPPPPSPPERTFNPAPIGALPTSGGLPGLLASDQLLGQAAPNTMYVGQRLMYEKNRRSRNSTRCAALGSCSKWHAGPS